jgi:hypothetical protein
MFISSQREISPMTGTVIINGILKIFFSPGSPIEFGLGHATLETNNTM